MKNSYYSMLNKIIRQMKADGKLIIKKSQLTDYIDLSEESREDIEEQCKNLMASVMAYQNNLRATIKGRGIFINVDLINNKQAMQMLIDNSNLDIESRIAVAQELKKKAFELPNADMAQMAFAMDADGETFFYTEMTDEELIDVLETLQNNTKVVNE